MSQRRLVIVRHAKAADGDHDRQRPLTPSGMTAAAEIGRWLASLPLMPDRVVVSPARRAEQTWAAAAKELTGAPDAVRDDRVYANTVDDLLAVVRETPSDLDTVVLVGHNPSMHAFAIAVDDGHGDPSLRDEVGARFPTAAVAVYGVDEEWAAFERGTLLARRLPTH
jgi:phosphohistidine phosphatase